MIKSKKEDDQTGHPRWVLRKVLKADNGVNFLGYEPIRNIGRQLLIPNMPTNHLGMCELIIDALYAAKSAGKCKGKEWDDALLKVENSLRLNILVNKGIVNDENVKNFTMEDFYSLNEKKSITTKNNSNRKRKFDTVNEGIRTEGSTDREDNTYNLWTKLKEIDVIENPTGTSSSPLKYYLVGESNESNEKLRLDKSDSYMSHSPKKGYGNSHTSVGRKKFNFNFNFQEKEKEKEDIEKDAAKQDKDEFQVETILNLVESKQIPTLPAIPKSVRMLLKENDSDSPIAELYPEYSGEELPCTKSKSENTDNKILVIQDDDEEDYEGACFGLAKTISNHMEILN